MKNLIVIGQYEYNEKMYPHLYEFLEILKKDANIFYIEIDDRGENLYKAGIEKNILNKIKYLLIFNIIKNKIIKRIEDVYKKVNVDYIIAIDHSALSISVRYHKFSKIIFWSHDMLTVDHERYNNFFIKGLIKKNKKDINKIDEIIIQDQNRGVVLDNLLLTKNIKKFFLPVSIRDDDYAKEISINKKNNGIKDLDNIKLLQITPHVVRGTSFIIEEYQKLDKKFSLYFKGKYPDKLLAKYSKKPIEIDINEKLSSMREVISDMDIGIVSYVAKDINEFFVAKASGQSVEFLRLGIPVVILFSYNLGEFIEYNNAGIFIDDINLLDKTLDRILKNYKEYSSNARKTFEKYHNIDSFMIEFKNEINN